VSKNFDFLGYMSLHGDVNYSLEGNDGDNFVDVRAGVEKTLGSSFSLLVEYDFALNDNNSDFGSGKGYLNAGIRWSPGIGFTVGFDLRDLLSNKSASENLADRSLKVEFIKNILIPIIELYRKDRLLHEMWKIDHHAKYNNAIHL
jgi:hypothetical protein